MAQISVSIPSPARKHDVLADNPEVRELTLTNGGIIYLCAFTLSPSGQDRLEALMQSYVLLCERSGLNPASPEDNLLRLQEMVSAAVG